MLDPAAYRAALLEQLTAFATPSPTPPRPDDEAFTVMQYGRQDQRSLPSPPPMRLPSSGSPDAARGEAAIRQGETTSVTVPPPLVHAETAPRAPATSLVAQPQTKEPHCVVEDTVLRQGWSPQIRAALRVPTAAESVEEEGSRSLILSFIDGAIRAGVAEDLIAEQVEFMVTSMRSSIALHGALHARQHRDRIREYELEELTAMVERQLLLANQAPLSRGDGAQHHSFLSRVPGQGPSAPLGGRHTTGGGEATIESAVPVPLSSWAPRSTPRLDPKGAKRASQARPSASVNGMDSVASLTAEEIDWCPNAALLKSGNFARDPPRGPSPTSKRFSSKIPVGSPLTPPRHPHPSRHICTVCSADPMAPHSSWTPGPTAAAAPSRSSSALAGRRTTPSSQPCVCVRENAMVPLRPFMQPTHASRTRQEAAAATTTQQQEAIADVHHSKPFGLSTVHWKDTSHQHGDGAATSANDGALRREKLRIRSTHSSRLRLASSRTQQHLPQAETHTLPSESAMLAESEDVRESRNITRCDEKRKRECQDNVAAASAAEHVHSGSGPLSTSPRPSSENPINLGRETQLGIDPEPVPSGSASFDELEMGGTATAAGAVAPSLRPSNRGGAGKQQQPTNTGTSLVVRSRVSTVTAATREPVRRGEQRQATSLPDRLPPAPPSRPPASSLNVSSAVGEGQWPPTSCATKYIEGDDGDANTSSALRRFVSISARTMQNTAQVLAQLPASSHTTTPSPLTHGHLHIPTARATGLATEELPPSPIKNAAVRAPSWAALSRTAEPHSSPPTGSGVR